MVDEEKGNEENIPGSSANDHSEQSADLEIDPKDYDESLFAAEDDIDLLSQISGIYNIWTNWAYFELSIVSPNISEYEFVKIIHPETIQGASSLEFVYPIFDYGNVLSTSKGSEMYSVGNSMCKLYYTIEKMICILLDKIKNASGGGNVDINSEVKFDGHQLAQRKAFESIINLNSNVVVINFDPGDWGNKYLQIIKKMAERGYGYPPEAPRYNYRSIVSKVSKTRGIS